MDAQIREFMNEQTAWQEQTEILSSVPDVRMVATTTLLADCPNWAKWIARRLQPGGCGTHEL